MKPAPIGFPSRVYILETLMDTVGQHACVKAGGFICTAGLSANEDALELLAEFGLAKDHGRKGWRLDYSRLIHLRKLEAATK